MVLACRPRLAVDAKVGASLAPQRHADRAVEGRLPRPGSEGKASLTRVAGDFAGEQLTKAGIVPPADPVDCCAAYLALEGERPSDSIPSLAQLA